MNKQELTYHIKMLAVKHGFAKAGAAKCQPLENERVYLEQWLSEGRNASMGWMGNNVAKRTNPAMIMEECISVISLAFVYNSGQKHEEGLPKISRYAWGGRDYHKALKKKLKALCAELEGLDASIKTRYYVDDGPVMEKAWAVKSGIGWMGKNTNIISKELGSFFFLSEILINKELEYDEPITDMCRGCRLCERACPTDALYEPYKLDANKCISFHTIENRGEIPEEINLNDWVFGCDICQDVCPYNIKSPITEDLVFQQRADVVTMLAERTELSEVQFNTLFEGTPVRRTKYSGWKRNLDKITSEREAREKAHSA